MDSATCANQATAAGCWLNKNSEALFCIFPGQVANRLFFSFQIFILVANNINKRRIQFGTGDTSVWVKPKLGCQPSHM